MYLFDLNDIYQPRISTQSAQVHSLFMLHSSLTDIEVFSLYECIDLQYSSLLIIRRFNLIK